MRKYLPHLLSGALLLLSYLDWLFTYTVLSTGGTELNPIAAYIIGHFTIWGLLLFKMVGTSVLALTCMLTKNVRLLILSSALMIFVCVWMAAQFALVLGQVHVLR